jgi:hypothetical protein
MVVTSSEKRRARRVGVNIPTVIEVVGRPDVELHPNLARVYERVACNMEAVGDKFTGVIRDLSTNGLFITGEPLPLLSRVLFKFSLEGFGTVEALGWTLWRRSADCELPRGNGGTITLPRGFGILLEAIPLDARLAIHEMVGAAGSASA